MCDAMVVREHSAPGCGVACWFMTVSFESDMRLMFFMCMAAHHRRLYFLYMLTLQFCFFCNCLFRNCTLSHKRAYVKRLTGNPLQCSGERIKKAPIQTESNEKP